MTRKSSKSVVPAATAALAWSSLGFRWMEMMTASSQVIARRTRRNPTAAQWVHMGSEKAQAALRSGNAMARASTSLPLGDPMAMWGAWARVLSAGMTPYRAKAVSNARSRRRR